MKISTLLLATTLTLGTAMTASAIDTSGKIKGNSTTITYNDSRDASRQELRQRINAKHREYVQLRQAGDPRAEDAMRELQALKAEWKQQYGGKNGDGARSEDMSAGKRHGKHNKNKH